MGKKIFTILRSNIFFYLNLCIEHSMIMIEVSFLISVAQSCLDACFEFITKDGILSYPVHYTCINIQEKEHI